MNVSFHKVLEQMQWNLETMEGVLGVEISLGEYGYIWCASPDALDRLVEAFCEAKTALEKCDRKRPRLVSKSEYVGVHLSDPKQVRCSRRSVTIYGAGLRGERVACVIYPDAHTLKRLWDFLAEAEGVLRLRKEEECREEESFPAVS